ncbi:MAG: hypothetical protein K2N33_03715 [Clostridia bacterium]|nr:hypothetical protein [Clostridia bacterium]
MSIIQIIDTFTFYGIDIIILAAATAVITQVLKKTLLKKVKKKLITFLPFGLGTLFYAVYAGIRNMSFYYLVNNYTSVLEHGLSVAAAATLLYVLYEQFVRESDSASSATEKVISTLIEGYVPEANLSAAAKAVAEALERDVTGNGATRAEEIIASYSDGEISEQDIKLLSKLIIETLAHMSVS